MYRHRNNIPRLLALLLPLFLWVAHPVHHPLPDLKGKHPVPTAHCLLCLIAAHTQPVETFAPEPVPEAAPLVLLPVERPERQTLARPERPGAGARAPPLPSVFISV